MVKKLLRLDLLKLCGLGGWTGTYLVLLLALVADARTALFGSVIFYYVAICVTMAYDEQSKGSYLLCTLPVTRRQIVQAKYLYALLVLLAVAVGSAGCTLLAAALSGGRTQSTLPMLAVMSMLGALFAALTIPLLLYLGTIKSRFWIMGLYGISIAGTTAFAGVANGFDHVIPQIAPFVAFLFTVAALAVSYLVAAKLYDRREFTE